MAQGVNVCITKEMFLEMEIQDKIIYLNEKLEEGMTVTEIRNELGVAEKKLQRLLKENGYRFNQKSKRYESNSKVNYKVEPITLEDVLLAANISFQCIRKMIEN